MTDDLTAFLLACFEESAAEAWWLLTHAADGASPVIAAAVSVLARRVLADIDAKRRIVEYPLSWPSLIRADFRAFTFLTDDANSEVVNQWARDEDGDLSHVVRRWTAADYESEVIEHVHSPILRLLALPYSDHPDYRSEWAPS